MLIVSMFILLTAVALPSVKATPTLLIRTTSLIFISSLFLVIHSYNWNGIGDGISLYNGLSTQTGVSMTAQALFLIVGSLALIPWGSVNTPGYTSVPRIGTYSLFALLSTIGGCLLVTSGDLITFYLSLELQSFSVYILAALYRDSESATHAGLLYFLLGGLSSSIILLGFALIYSETGLTSIDSIMNLIHVGDDNNISWGILFGFICIGSGLLFKITAAPFHNWGPDVYDGVPTIVTTWLAVLPKISLVMLFLILSTNLNGTIKLMSNYDLWVTLLLVSSVLSLIVGSIVGLVQTRVKRLLAYSTISHIGFILLSMSVSTLDGSSATIFYLMQYTMVALLSFSAVLALGYLNAGKENSADMNWIKDFNESVANNPGPSISMAVALFSMAGVPPLLGFYGKQAVLYASMNAGLYFVSIVAVVTSVISASYYLYLVRVTNFSTSTGVNESSTNNLTSIHSYTLSLMTLITISFMACPDLIIDFCRLVSLSYYNT